MTPRIVAALRQIIAASLVLGAGVIVYALVVSPTSRVLGQFVVFLALVAVASSLLWVDLVCPSSPGSARLGRVGVLATSVAFAISLLLAWTPFITSGLVWRAWWLASAVSVCAAHILVLLRARRTPRLTRVRNVTIAGIVVFGAIVAGMTLRADVFVLPGPILSTCLYVAGSIAALGSAILLVASQPGVVRVPWTAVRAARWVAFPVLIFAVGFYAGRVSVPIPGILESGLGSLAGLSSETVESQVRSDFSRLQTITQGLEQERAKAESLRIALATALKSEGRGVYTPEEDDRIRALFFSYLSYRTALLRMVAFCQGFEGLDDPALRARCFLVGFAAGAVCFDASLALVATYFADPMARAKLNEPITDWGIPAGMFDRIRESVALEANFQLFEEMLAYFETHRERWRASGFAPGDIQWLEGAIEHSAASVKTNPLFGKRLSIGRIIEKVKSDAYTPVYAVQSLLSTWVGDTRLVARTPCVSAAQVEELRTKLRPGDIILERRNWFLSNAFLPGFWPHAALYVGTVDDLKRLGIADEAPVRDRLAGFTTAAHDGEARCVVESISEGVSFSSLSEATRADYIAVLRPRVGDAEKARAIARAFSHHGKPYDFEFDFFSADKLVCTELVYRAYEGILHFDLVKIMGRMTLPAVEIARKFVRERDAVASQLEFVHFLDALPGGDGASSCGCDEFCISAERPRAFNE